MEFYVYVYLNPLKPGKYKYGNYEFDYEPFYLGKGKGRQYKRHLNESLDVSKNKDKTELIVSIKSDGKESIILILDDSLEEKESFNLENKLINLIGRKDLNKGPLLNHINGGGGGTPRELTDELKFRYGSGTRGKTYEEIHGIEKAKELRDNRSESNRNREVSDETKEKISKSREGIEAWNKGRKNVYSEESLKKMSESKMGKNNPVYGKNIKPIKINAESDGSDLIFNSKGEACRYFKISMWKLNNLIVKQNKINNFMITIV